MTKRVRGSAGKARPVKRVTEEPSASDPDRYLVWRFGRLDFVGSFACYTLDRADVPDLQSELVVFQKEPIWSLRRKNWLKFIPVDQMTPAGQKRLSQVSKQENGLWQLHLQRNKWRVWGYYEEPEFFFLWWDSGHGVATGRSRGRRSA